MNLIEFTIILTIIGLLIGAVMKGQQIIDESKNGVAGACRIEATNKWKDCIRNPSTTSERICELRRRLDYEDCKEKYEPKVTH